MKIAIAQLNYTIGDVDGNASKIIDSIHKAKAQHADLVIFAEQAVSGTPAFDLLRKTTFLELCEDALVEIASCCDGIAAIVGLPILTADGTISAAALIQDRKVLRYIGKKYITARREMGFLVPSKGYEYATIKGHKCAIIVGDDLSRERDFDQSVETVISINARKYGKGTMTYRYEMMRNLAFVESKNLVLVNQVGGSTDIVYDGTSGALNSRGELVLMMKNFEEDFQIFDTKASARPISIPSTYNDRTRLVYEAARCGLRDFFRKNGYRKASIGLSGGIDSAVVASIAADALGAENVRALLMPSPFSSLESVEDAKELARNLGARAILLRETEQGRRMAEQSGLSDVCALITDDWDRIWQFLRAGERTAVVERRTRETDIRVRLDLDGSSTSRIDTGLKFFDHMLDQIVHHAGISLDLQVRGDLQVDEHHTIEDTAIALGEAIRRALGSKLGIGRYGFCLPMDECRAAVLLDFGGRIELIWNARFSREYVGDVPTEMFRHFFKSLAESARCNLYVEAEGENEHHKIEAIFKAFARALRTAIARDNFHFELPSSKGTL